MGILTKISYGKSHAPHIPGVSPLGLNIDRCITLLLDLAIEINHHFLKNEYSELSFCPLF